MSYNPFVEEFGSFGIGNFSLRGRVEITGLKSTYEYEFKRPKGQTGAKTKYLGRKERPFTVRVTLFTAEDYETYKACRREALPPPDAKKPYAVAVYHPLLNEDYEIDQAVLVDDPQPERNDQFKYWVVTFGFVELPPEPKTTATKVTGNPDIPTAAKVAEVSPRAAEIEAARQRNGILRAGLAAQQKARDAYVRKAAEDANGLLRR